MKKTLLILLVLITSACNTPTQNETENQTNEENTNFKIELDKKIFQKNTPLFINLYNDKDEVNEKEAEIKVIKDISEDIEIDSEKIKSDGTFKVFIKGRANDECREITSTVTGEVNNKKEISISDIKYDYSKFSCISGKITDESGNLVNDINFITSNTSGQNSFKDGKFFFHKLESDKDTTIFVGGRKWLLQKKNFIPTETHTKLDFIVKKQSEEIQNKDVSIKIKNDGLDQNSEVKLFIIINNDEFNKREIKFKPENKDFSTIILEDVRVGDTYTYSVFGKKVGDKCETEIHSGFGLISDTEFDPQNNEFHINHSENEKPDNC